MGVGNWECKEARNKEEGDIKESYRKDVIYVCAESRKDGWDINS